MWRHSWLALWRWSAGVAEGQNMADAQCHVMVVPPTCQTSSLLSPFKVAATRREHFVGKNDAVWRCWLIACECSLTMTEHIPWSDSYQDDYRTRSLGETMCRTGGWEGIVLELKVSPLFSDTMGVRGKHMCWYEAGYEHMLLLGMIFTPKRGSLISLFWFKCGTCLNLLKIIADICSLDDLYSL